MKRMNALFILGLLTLTLVAPTAVFAQGGADMRDLRDTGEETLNEAEANREGCGFKKEVKRFNTAVDSTCIEEEESCNGKTTKYSCCLCQVTIADGRGSGSIIEAIGEGSHTYASCEALCTQGRGSATKGEIYRQVGAGTLPRAATTTASGAPQPTGAQIQETLKYCFTPSECAAEDYGGSASAFRSGYGCPSGKGRCIAPEPIVDLSFPIGNIKTVTGFRGFVATIFNYAIGISAVAAAVMFVWGGFRYIFGSAFQSVGRGKEIMIDAAIGLVLTLGAMTILRTINPATLNLNKLEVFMINREMILNEKFCANIKDPSGKKLMFADAGPRPNFTPVAQLTASDYIVPQEETKCNYNYYVDGYGDSKCGGSKCDQGGYACVSCRSGFCGGGDKADPLSYECVKASWAGNVAFTGERSIDAVIPIVICAAALNAGVNDYDGPKNAMFALGTQQSPAIRGKTGDSGTQGYSFDLTASSISEAQSDCQSHGGVAGFVLGVQYNDNQGILPFGFGPSNDDIAILGKNNCGSGAFSAYADGTATSFDLTDMKRAIWCGIYHTSPVLKNPSNFWTVDDLQKAIGSNGDLAKSIVCDFQLSDANAPSNPVASNKFMAGCTSLAPGSQMNLGDQILDAIVN